jgi:hypothetical protein
MVESTQSKRVWNWVWPLLPIGVLICLAVALLIYFYVDRLPEKELAKEFLRTNANMIDYFGEVLSISSGTSGARVSYRFNERERQGYYSFHIKGTTRAGEVVIDWTSEGSGRSFTVDKVYVFARGKGPIVLWAYPNES